MSGTFVCRFVGIGYFTLPYLVHARAAHVHACEWNPNAVQALRENLRLNGVADRCTVYEGDNRQVNGFLHSFCLVLCPRARTGFSCDDIIGMFSCLFRCVRWAWPIVLIWA